jgi:hypothetical protein
MTSLRKGEGILSILEHVCNLLRELDVDILGSEQSMVSVHIASQLMGDILSLSDDLFCDGVSFFKALVGLQNDIIGLAFMSSVDSTYDA